MGQRTSPAVKQGVIGPSLLMKQRLWCWYVWNDPGTTTDSWIPGLCRATVRPLSQHKSANLKTVLATVSSCVCTRFTCKKKTGSQPNSQMYASFLSTLRFLLKLLYELLCVFLLSPHGVSPDQRVQTSCFLAHVLILFLPPLIFSAALTFNPCHS